ncbi:hypothetical protein ACFY2V_39760 [Streptomyces eurythermus]|uniref:hypothetical protein n=1 Tax=Streptomyces eurythermus TaxID=42237 RepID=UPI00367BD63F
MNTLLPSTLMAVAGIVQEGDVLLQTVAQPFDLPTEADEARHVVRELNAAISGVKELHDFGKGMGIAAPQISIGPRRRRHRSTRRRIHSRRYAC